MTGSMDTGLDAVTAHPVETIAGAIAVLLVTAGIGLALRSATVRLWSLRAQLLAISLAGTVVGALVAWLLAMAMILDEAQLVPTLAVLVVTFVLAAVIVTIASSPLGATAHRLADTVAAIEGGDRQVRTGIDRRDELGLVADALDQLTVRLADLEAERGRLDAGTRPRCCRASATTSDRRLAAMSRRGRGDDGRPRARPRSLPAVHAGRRRSTHLARRRRLPARQHPGRTTRPRSWLRRPPASAATRRSRLFAPRPPPTASTWP
ncbi:MAG: methyl-accepting chemotaxis protein [Microthrixaceae bacterium]